jgi:hypothetical protein
MTRRLNRTRVCYTPRPILEEDLRLMRRIDELHLEHCKDLRDFSQAPGVKRMILLCLLSF